MTIKIDIFADFSKYHRYFKQVYYHLTIKIFFFSTFALQFLNYQCLTILNMLNA